MLWQKVQHQRLRNFEYFFIDMSDLLAAGIDLDQALDQLAQVGGSKVRMVRQMQSSIRRGIPLDQVFVEAGFPELVQPYLQIGQATGEFAKALDRLSSFLSKRRMRKERMVKVSVYPMLLLILSILSMFMLVWQVIPNFVRFYHSLHLEVPALVQWIMHGTVAFVTLFPYVFVLAVAGGITLRLTHKIWYYRLERKLVAKKWIGSWIRLVKALQFFEFMSALLGAGVDLLGSIQVLIESDTAHMRDDWQKLKERVTQGESLSHVLGELDFIPDVATKMIYLSEQTGDLELVTARLAGYFERTIERRMEKFFAVFEPLSLIVLGLIVGGVTLILFLPLTDLVKQLS